MLLTSCLVTALVLGCSATAVPNPEDHWVRSSVPDLDLHPLHPRAEHELEPRQMAKFGPNVHMGPTKSGRDIVGLSCVFRPGYPPAKPVRFLAVWPGLWNPSTLRYDLIQSVISSHDQAYMTSFCGAKPGQWCLQPYVLATMTPKTIKRGYAIDGSDEIEIIYKKELSGKGTWMQGLKNLSKGIKYPDFFDGSAAATTFETGTEMQGSNKGSADTQIYQNLTLTLRVADPSFGRTYRKHAKVIANPPTTPDSGKTWVFDRIEIPAMLPGTAFKPT